jgi:hypothetical protein
LEPSAIQTVSACEPRALPISMHSRLCSIACRRVAASVWESEPNLFENVARLADAGKAGEARAAGPDAPGWNGDVKGGDLPGHAVDIDATPRKLLAQRSIVGGERFAQRPVVLGDHIR